MNSPQERREECRREVLAFLSNRSVLAFRTETIRRKLAAEFDFSVDEVGAALTFLIGAGHVAEAPDPQGATKYYRATAAGVLFHERNP